MTTLSRRDVLKVVAVTATVPYLSVHSRASTVSNSPPGFGPIVPERVQEKFQSIPYESQEIGGMLSDRMQMNVYGRLLHIDEKAFLAGFAHRNDAGDADGAWVGEHAGKFLDAACNAVRLRDNADLRSLMDRVARTLIASQESDGYLGTYPTSRRWTGWDVWVHKYNLIGLLSYYELSGDPTALMACRKMGDLLGRTFGDGPGQRDLILAGEHMGMAATSVLEPVCTLYRLTGEKRYLNFCRYIVRAYDHPQGPRIVSSLLAYGNVYLTADAKAYEMLSNLNGVIDLYRVTDEEHLLDAVMLAWRDIVQHQLYFTGTTSASECFQPRGRLLTLKSSNMGEMCVTVTWLQLNWRLLRLTGDPKFGQEIERTVFNHLLAAQDPRSGDIAYYTGLVGRKDYTNHVLCCVSSGPRGISLIPQVVWGLETNAFVIHLYTAGRASFQMEGVPVRVVSDTRFPADGAIALAVNPERAVRFTVRLRVPEWATRFEVHTGSKTLAGIPGRMLDITQTWLPSSTVQIRMELPPRPLPGAPTYGDYLALQRGPQVLALEEAVNPTLPYLERVALNESSAAPVAEPAAVPAGWVARQVYAVDAIVGIADGGSQLVAEKRKAMFVPFADAADARVWLTRADRMRTDIPAVTAFGRAGASGFAISLGPKDPAHVPTDVGESLTDEDHKMFCRADPRDMSIATYLGKPPGKRGDPVFFYVTLDRPTSISRVVFKNGPIDAGGGWFDTSAGKPMIEITRTPVALLSGVVPDTYRTPWEKVAEMDDYPNTNASTQPAIAEGQAFEVHLPQPIMVQAIRVICRSGGDYVNCAELAAFA